MCKKVNRVIGRDPMKAYEEFQFRFSLPLRPVTARQRTREGCEAGIQAMHVESSLLDMHTSEVLYDSNSL